MHSTCKSLGKGEGEGSVLQQAHRIALVNLKDCEKRDGHNGRLPISLSTAAAMQFFGNSTMAVIPLKTENGRKKAK